MSRTLVHMIHKGSRGVSQAKWHHWKFIMIIPSLKCGVGDDFKVNLKLMVPRPQINPEKDFCFL